jgi:ribosomal protein S18 acetylase RimI-like enzyme
MEDDQSFWFKLDRHLSKNEFQLKIRDKRGYVICDDDKPIGVMRYNLFWDNTPFLTMIYLIEPYRRKGFGRKAMQYWENEMRDLGYKIVMLSTQVNEEAQHFYRKLGYKDNGGIFLDTQPEELIMMKVL